MDGDICPPYIPDLIWQLLHHHGPTPDPGDGRMYAVLDKAFANIAIAALAMHVGNQELAQSALGAGTKLLGEAGREG